MNKHLRDNGSDITLCGRLVSEVPSVSADSRFDRREVCRVCLRGRPAVEATERLLTSLLELHRRLTYVPETIPSGNLPLPSSARNVLRANLRSASPRRLDGG
jgi:hypothetical protein